MNGQISRREQWALTTLGAFVLVGLALSAWLGRSALLHIEDAPSTASARWNQAVIQAEKVHLNTATQEELVRLPRIGPALASRILAARKQRGGFTRVNDLLDIPGIGPKLLEQLVPMLTVE